MRPPTTLPLVNKGKLRYHDRMSKRNQNGGVGVILVIVLLVVMLGGLGAFTAQIYSNEQKYKNHADALITVAVANAKQKQQAVDSAQYAEEAKSPLRAYDGPQAYGSLVVNYPKTWSAFVDDSGTGTALVDGYFASGTVPSTNATGSVFALRVRVLQQTYSSVVNNFQGQEQAGQITSLTAYALPKVPSVVGVEITGNLGNNHTGTMVVLPLRSYTLEISTDGSQYLGDLNNYILPNFSFSP